jgi:hypothetical protein
MKGKWVTRCRLAYLVDGGERYGPWRPIEDFDRLQAEVTLINGARSYHPKGRVIGWVERRRMKVKGRFCASTEEVRTAKRVNVDRLPRADVPPDLFALMRRNRRARGIANDDGA